MTDISELLFTALSAVTIPGGWHQASSLGIGLNPQIPARPYGVWTELANLPANEVRETSLCKYRTFQIWTYDDQGDYGQINSTLAQAEVACRGLAFYVASDGYVVMDQLWQGLSALIPADPAYHVISRFGTCRFTVNQ